MQPFENQQKSDGNNNLTHTITNSLFISCKQLNILFIFKTICLSVPSKKKKKLCSKDGKTSCPCKVAVIEYTNMYKNSIIHSWYSSLERLTGLCCDASLFHQCSCDAGKQSNKNMT